MTGNISGFGEISPKDPKFKLRTRNWIFTWVYILHFFERFFCCQISPKITQFKIWLRSRIQVINSWNESRICLLRDIFNFKSGPNSVECTMHACKIIRAILKTKYPLLFKTRYSLITQTPSHVRVYQIFWVIRNIGCTWNTVITIDLRITQYFTWYQTTFKNELGWDG